MIRSTIIKNIFKYSRSISNSLIMPLITMRSTFQIISMAMERERDGDGDRHGGGGAAVPLSSDKMDLRSLCDSLCGVSLFTVAVM
jgi:hypothetical protein